MTKQRIWTYEQLEAENDQKVLAITALENIRDELQIKNKDLLKACEELAGIFPESSMSEMDAADFKDRANRIWVAAQGAKAAIAKAQPKQSVDL